MQLDGTIQLPGGQEVPVVVEVDPGQLETRLANLRSADVITRAIEVLGSTESALVIKDERRDYSEERHTILGEIEERIVQWRTRCAAKSFI